MSNKQHIYINVLMGGATHNVHLDLKWYFLYTNFFYMLYYLVNKNPEQILLYPKYFLSHFQLTLPSLGVRRLLTFHIRWVMQAQVSL